MARRAVLLWAAFLTTTSGFMVAPHGLISWPGPHLQAAGSENEVQHIVDLKGVAEAMEDWVSSSVAPEGHSKRHLIHMVSEGVTLPAVLADFWHAVS